ncbi:MAG TPA: YlxR family protein [Anaeromyxobacteraceae bacterium]|nr:YlxR family protein [Anaeromyxobacteraceae bacterium]
MEPVRTCIGCGERVAQKDLVRLRAREGHVEVDRARAGGRGAYLHAAQGCLERALRRRAFGRAFRDAAALADAGLIRDLLTGNARKD